MTALHAFDLGYGVYRLHDGTCEIGWSSGGTLGFRGYATLEMAVDAAVLAHRALSRWLARQHATSPTSERAHLLDVRRQGAHTELALGDVIVGWVMPMEHEAVGRTMEFAFALRLPATHDAARALGAARAVHRVLARRAAAEAGPT